MKKVFNFSAGPSTLPKAVLTQAQRELLNYNKSGMSVMEMSHRSNDYETIHNQVVENFKKLMNIQDSHEVLFVQGGASMQFAMIPLNFANEKTAYYIDGGIFGTKAFEEGKRVLKEKAKILASSKDSNYTNIPKLPEIPSDAAYVHFTSNNTTEGTMRKKFPQTEVPIIVDMSSNILSYNYDMNEIDLAYAGAQKNLGPAGVAVVIVKKSLLETINDSNLPAMLNYNTYASKNSMYNTPPTFSIYMMGLVLEWVLRQGGSDKMEELAVKKSNLLYDFIDNSKLFKTKVNNEDRSINNITFTTGDEEMDLEVVDFCDKNNLKNLKGHRQVGGLRASIYNAMELEGVEALIRCLQVFENKNGG